jgi:predicted RND superfamily exporter protein
VIARISLWQAIGIVIYMGAGIALLLLLMTYPAILDRLDRWADKRSEDDQQT